MKNISRSKNVLFQLLVLSSFLLSEAFCWLSYFLLSSVSCFIHKKQQKQNNKKIQLFVIIIRVSHAIPYYWKLKYEYWIKDFILSHVGATSLQLPFSWQSRFVGPSKWYPVSQVNVTICPAQ